MIDFVGEEGKAGNHRQVAWRLVVGHDLKAFESDFKAPYAFFKDKE